MEFKLVTDSVFISVYQSIYDEKKASYGFFFFLRVVNLIVID